MTARVIEVGFDSYDYRVIVIIVTRIARRKIALFASVRFERLAVWYAKAIEICGEHGASSAVLASQKTQLR